MRYSFYTTFSSNFVELWDKQQYLLLPNFFFRLIKNFRCTTTVTMDTDRYDSYYLQPIYNLFHFWKDQQGGTLLKLYLFLMYIWDFQIYLTHRCSRSFHSGHLHSPKTSCIHSYFMKTFQILQSSFPSNFWHWLTITWEKNLIVCMYILFFQFLGLYNVKKQCLDHEK